MHAPAQWMPHSQLLNHVEGLDGPWCDMWAVGIIITQLCLGKSRSEEKDRVSSVCVYSGSSLLQTSLGQLKYPD